VTDLAPFSRDDLPVIADRINSRETQIRAMLSQSVHLAALTGRDLIHVKSGLRHGEFVPWLKKNCRLSKSTANDYMRLFRENPEFVCPEKCPPNVSATTLAELQRAPAGVRRVIEERIASGEFIGRGLIRQLSGRAPKPVEKRDRPESWMLTDHVCRHCCGRLLKRRLSQAAIEVICAKCETRATGDELALCWCGKSVGTYGRIFECIKNPNRRPELPNAIMVRERRVDMQPVQHRPSRFVNCDGLI
jgi:hypothetical protein